MKLRLPHSSRTLLLRQLALAIAISANSLIYATTYYVNSVTGSNSNPGTSSAAPWLDFTNINAHGAFVAGDQILLARGSVWNQQMDLYGSGSSVSPIILDAYGSGNDPRIQRNSNVNDRTIVMHDPSNWIVRNLEVCNAGDGIEAMYTSLGHENLRFENLFLHDINLIMNGLPSSTPHLYYSSGIYIFAPSTVPLSTSSQWLCRNITIVDSVFINTTAAFLFVQQDAAGNETPYSFQNVRIKSSRITNARGAMSMRGMTNGKIISCLMNNLCTSAAPQGTAGIFQWRTSNISYLNNITEIVPDTGSADQTVLDLEGYNDTTLLAGNYVAWTAGPGIEFLQLPAGANPPRNPATDYNTNNTLIGNVFVQNGGYALKVVTSGNIPTGALSANLYHEPSSGFTTGNFSGFTQSNNTSVTNLSSIYNAGKDYSGTQGVNHWSYQLYNGTGYSNLSYDAVNEWWGTSSGRISQFDALPDSTSSNWIARAWTAPFAGAVMIRGRVLKNDINGGDGVKARVTKNGTVIWPTNGIPQTIGAADDSGVDTNLDGVSVVLNDVLRFEVNNGGAGNSANDLTSWNPTVVLPTAAGAFLESGGKVSIEAETATESSAYAYTTTRSSHAWSSVTGTSGNAMQVTPDNGSFWTDTATLNANSPEMTYNVKFATAGSYKVWMLVFAANGGTSDSIHVGLDDIYTLTNITIPNGSWIWVNIGTISSITAGYHDINLWAREDGFMVDKIYLTTGTDTPTGTGQVQSTRESITSSGAFLESGGTASIEAENATENSTYVYTTDRSSHAWSSVAGTSGNAMQVTPDNGSFWTDTATLNANSPEMTYNVKFATAGSYKVWLLVKAADYAADSIHVGLDDVYKLTNTTIPIGSWTWVSVGTISSITAGYHDINLWAREDGTIVDKIYLTTGADTPTGAGPAQSARE